jgi:hypothetical protein
MVRHIRLRNNWVSKPHILTEQIIKRCVRSRAVMFTAASESLECLTTVGMPYDFAPVFIFNHSTCCRFVGISYVGTSYDAL